MAVPAYPNYPPSKVGAWPGVNLTWATNPTGSTEYALENQTNAIANARTAIAAVNYANMDTAIQGIQWALDRQVVSGPANPPENAPGSIPGNATGTVGRQAHSLLVFYAQLGELCRELIASPAMAAHYAAQLALWKQRLVLTTAWIMRDDVQPQTLSFNKDYAHRRMMAAAVLYDTTYLNPGLANAAAINARARAYVLDGLTCQFPAGTYAVLPQAGLLGSDGFPLPAPVLFPAGYTPNPDLETNQVFTVGANSAGTFTLAGATGEAKGWDIGYAGDYVSLACYVADVCPDADLIALIYAACDRLLTWECTRLIQGGTNFSIVGSWRIGHEPSPNNPALTKALSVSSLAHGFSEMAVRSTDPALRAQWTTVNSRLRGHLARLPDPPPAPLGLVVVPSDGGGSAVWGEIDDTNIYLLYARQAGGVPMRLGGGPYMDPAGIITGLTNGQAYLICVTATGAGGESQPSAEVALVPAAPVVVIGPNPPAPPTPPPNIRAYGKDSAVRATSDPSPAPIKFYSLYYKIGNGAFQKVNKQLDSPTYLLKTVDGIINDTPVTVYFTATDALGQESQPSQTFTVTPTAAVVPTQAPPAPTMLTAVGGDGLVTLDCEDVAGATFYNAYWRDAQGNRSALPGNPLPASGYVDNTIGDGETRVYTMTAGNDAGESPESPPASATEQGDEGEAALTRVLMAQGIGGTTFQTFTVTKG